MWWGPASESKRIGGLLLLRWQRLAKAESAARLLLRWLLLAKAESAARLLLLRLRLALATEAKRVSPNCLPRCLAAKSALLLWWWLLWRLMCRMTEPKGIGSLGCADTRVSERTRTKGNGSGGGQTYPSCLRAAACCYCRRRRLHHPRSRRGSPLLLPGPRLLGPRRRLVRSRPGYLGLHNSSRHNYLQRSWTGFHTQQGTRPEGSFQEGLRPAHRYF